MVQGLRRVATDDADARVSTLSPYRRLALYRLLRGLVARAIASCTIHGQSPADSDVYPVFAYDFCVAVRIRIDAGRGSRISKLAHYLSDFAGNGVSADRSDGIQSNGGLGD